MRRDDIERRTRRVWHGARFASVGLEMAISVVLGWYAGSWLDDRFGWAPWASITGLVLGFVAGLRTLVLAGRRASRATDDEDAGGGGDRG